ncbi:hypothetical protein M798_03450 [Brucella melitensis ADMAS-G1]|nr:hypothetical protein M798_03450 [Brucella melitensis ADMAS-G1]
MSFKVLRIIDLLPFYSADAQKRRNTPDRDGVVASCSTGKIPAPAGLCSIPKPAILALSGIALPFWSN